MIITTRQGELIGARSFVLKVFLDTFYPFNDGTLR
jgi:hypothetical protein